MTRTLLLDLDGTLVDSVPDLLASCNRVMVSRGFAPLTRAEVVPMIGDGAAVLVGKAMAARGQVAAPEDLQVFLADYMAHLAANLTANLTQGARPYPGVPETLEQLARTGWRLAICTNKPAAAARALLARLSLLHLFAAVGGGDSYPVRKPDPGHLLATLAEAGGGPAIMVGDHHNDVAAAHAAGLPCIFAAWGYGPPSTGADAEATAHAFAEIPELARRLLTPVTMPQTG